MTSIREVAEGTQEQGVDEIIVYTLDCTRYGEAADAVSSPVITVYEVDEDDNPNIYTDVTNDVMPVNSPTVGGQIITFSPLQDLEVDKLYRCSIEFVKDVNTYSVYALIRCRL